MQKGETDNMCGIVGYVGKNNCVRVLIDGLEKLEYRGYDSAGIAYFNQGKINIFKESEKLENLKNELDLSIGSNIGIGHTRWATHGTAKKENSHPHQVGKFTIVHNGIIENYVDIKCDLEKKGYVFNSDTDTEVLCALLDYLYKSDKNVLNVIIKASEMVKGSYAVGVLCDDEKDKIYVMKNKSPLIIGVGKDENFIASDVPAILDKTDNYISLEDGDYGVITKDKIKVYNDKKLRNYEVEKFEFGADLIDKKGYSHYMLKEIHEQPDVFKKTVNEYVNTNLDGLIKKMPDFTKYNKIRIVACGSATHAALVGKQMLEEYGNVKTDVETASEFRYSKPFLSKDELVIVISQSGETADTLEALKLAKDNGNDTLGIINAKGSSIARSADMVLYTQAGKEIAVATTKAYSAQVAMLSLIALNLSYRKDLISSSEIKEILNSVRTLPSQMEELLGNDEKYKEIAEKLAPHNDIFFIGRKVDYALAQEGSLKLKEISYTHSDAYAAGELKHGTISLIEPGTPVIAIVTDDFVAPKTVSNMIEVKSRGANVLYITNKTDDLKDGLYDERLVIPRTHKLFSPLLTIIPLQMIAYEVAKIKGCNIDKPKNLAKSVTVE